MFEISFTFIISKKLARHSSIQLFSPDKIAAWCICSLSNSGLKQINSIQSDFFNLIEGKLSNYPELNLPKREFSTEFKNSIPISFECFSISSFSKSVFAPYVLPYFF